MTGCWRSSALRRADHRAHVAGVGRPRRPAAARAGTCAARMRRGRCTGRAATPGPAQVRAQGGGVGQLGVDQSAADARRTGRSPSGSHCTAVGVQRRRVDRPDRRDAVDREAAGTSSLRWSWAVSWPPSTRSGSTIRSRRWRRGCRRSRSARCPRPRRRSRSAASAPAGVVGSAGARPRRGRPGRRRGWRSTAAATWAVSRAACCARRRGGRAACGRAAGRAGRPGRCRRRPRPPAPAPSSRSRGSSTSSGVVLTSDGRREPAQPERAGLRVVEQLGQRGLVVGAQEGLGVADAQRAEGARRVVDQVGQRLRHRGARDRAEEVVHLQPPTSRRRRRAAPSRGEAVDGGAAARLHVGEQVQGAGDRGLQRPGRDGGQVGLEQDVVDRVGQQRGERRDRGRRGRRPTQRPAVGGQPAERRPRRAAAASSSGRATRSARDRGRRGRSQRDPVRPARARRCRWRAPRPSGSPASASRAIRRLSTWSTLESSGRQRVPRLAGRVPGADQAGQPRRWPARRAPGRPSAPRSAPRVHTSKASVGSQTPRCRRAAALGEQPGGGGHLDEQRRASARRRAAAAAAALRSRTPSPPLRSAPAAAVPQWSSSSSTRRTTSKAAPAAVRSTRAASRSVVASSGTSSTGSRGRATAAQGEPHLAGQHCTSRRRAAPAAGARSAPRRASSASRGRDRAPRGAGGALAALGVDVVEQGARGRG